MNTQSASAKQSFELSDFMQIIITHSVCERESKREMEKDDKQKESTGIHTELYTARVLSGLFKQEIDFFYNTEVHILISH